MLVARCSPTSIIVCSTRRAKSIKDEKKRELFRYLCGMGEERLDKILIQRKLVTTRVRAEKIIRETGVLVNGKLVTKTGKRFPLDCEIEMLAEEIPWVSRGAIKLLAAIEKWNPTCLLRRIHFGSPCDSHSP